MLLNDSNNKKSLSSTFKQGVKVLAPIFFIMACTPSAEKPLQRFQHAVEGSYA